MPLPAGQPRPETLFAPIVERRFLVADFFVGVVERGADKNYLSEIWALQVTTKSVVSHYR